jgi:hypothetical protein
MIMNPNIPLQCRSDHSADTRVLSGRIRHAGSLVFVTTASVMPDNQQLEIA